MKSTHKGIYKINDPKRKNKWCWERRVEGKRTRTFFFSLEEAIVCKKAAEADAKANGGSLRMVFDSKAQKEYLTAKEILNGVSLIESALFYRKHYEHLEVKSAPIEVVVREVLEHAGQGATEKHRKALEAQLWRFAEHFKGRQISMIQPKEILKWANSLGYAPNTVLWLMQKITFLFNRAKSLGYLREFDGFDKSLLPKAQKTPIEVYSLDEVSQILRYAHKTCPIWLPNIALRCFVGLRTEEASKMLWEWIDIERKKILIPAEICKTRDDWVLQSPNLPDTIFKWLKLTPEEKRVGKIPTPPRALGRVIKLPLKTNGFRHTFCTMHISLFGSADKTATLLKHKGTSVLYQHYLGKLVSEEEAKAYFSLTPHSSKI